MPRRRYLCRLGLEAARALWLQRPEVDQVGPSETLPTPQTRDRVTAEAVFAARSVPHYHCSAMDGVALRAAATFGASEVRPVRLGVADYSVVDTGDPLPAGADAVVMIEDVQGEIGEVIELIEPASPWQHVRLAGEDLVATELVLPSGHRLRAADLAALLSCGVREVSVRRRPRVVVLPTGDELVDALAPSAEQERTGAIIESNSHMLAGLVEEWGGEAVRMPILPDTREAIRAALRIAVESAELVLLNAGSSAGREDFTPVILQEEGELLAHGVDIMPGKPMALAVVRGRPVLAVPGYPVSAWVVCEQFLRPALTRRLGLPEPQPEHLAAELARKTPSRTGTEEFLRVKTARVGGRWVAAPLARGASLLNSVVRADAVLRIPAQSEGVEAGAPVQLELLRPRAELEGTRLAIGSHDLLLDLIADFLRRRTPGRGLSSSHVGSLAGLMALQRGECHLAGTHLMDEETGEYNLTWVRRFFRPGEAAVFRLAARSQGLIVPRGNPRGLTGLASLFERQVQYVNRQRGSGTRQLLDYHLQRLDLNPARLAGYDRELHTHLAVAAAVKTGGGDTGLAILAAARALDLEFLPVAEEQYDLVVRCDLLEDPVWVEIEEIIQDPEFRARVAELGGYDLRDAGRRLL